MDIKLVKMEYALILAIMLAVKMLIVKLEITYQFVPVRLVIPANRLVIAEDSILVIIEFLQKKLFHVFFSCS